MYSGFEQIQERLAQGRLWDFPGGVHPEQFKSLSNQTPIATLPLPGKLFVTVKQHIGAEGHLCVDVGQYVLKGQPLTRSTNPFSVPVHAPTSGTVSAIGEHVSAHPSGLPKQTIEITPDGKDAWVSLKPIGDYTQQPKVKIVEAICEAGISGMGGAGFPTHIKVSPKKNLEFLIINGIECEPYISADDRLMREHAWQVRQGIDVLTHLLSPKQVIIAIEDNKPEAIKAMQVACRENPRYRVVSVPTKYPAGGEKQLIQVLTNREVPHRGLPIDVGVIMQNVGTCFAIADAIFAGKPLIQRVVTLTGQALKQPKNVWALIGTPMSHLLSQSEYQAKLQKQPQVIMGGPMMGFTVASEQVPVVKITNCMLVPAKNEVADSDNEQPCIRCSACADACPASLLPQQLFWHASAKEYDKAQNLNLFDCIECGACAYVCPSEIPLVHYYRKAKADIRHEEQEKDKADKARERFEARKARLVREQQERDEKHRKAAEARKKAMQSNDSGAKDKIAAALARAKAKRQKAPVEADAKDVVAQSEQPNAETKSPATDPQSKVAAAVARAKAKKAAQAQAASETPDAAVAQQNDAASDSKQARIAKAVAKAKANKAQAKDNTAADSVKQQATDEAPKAKSDKQEKIAQAVAKAKAKRAQSQQASDEQNEAQQTAADKNSDAKQEKIAQAIAKAKAKRAALKDTKNNEN